MKAQSIALLIVSLLTGSLVIAVEANGWHSTPAIRLAIPNFPGLLMALYVGLLIPQIQNSDLAAYAIAAPVNWVFYFYSIKLVIWLERKFARWLARPNHFV